MRSLLVLIVVPLVGCVTTEGARHVRSQRFVSTSCQRGRPYVGVDSTKRDRVRLVFNRVDPCVDTYDVTSTVETDLVLAQPVRVGLGILAGVVVAVPLIAVVALIAPSHDASPGTTPYEVNTALGQFLAYPVIGAGLGVYHLTGGRMNGTPYEITEQVERDLRPATADVALRTGVVAGGGLVPRPLVHGVLDLTLAEGAALDPRALTFDGVPVDLPPEAEERLSFLATCQSALNGYDATKVDQLKPAELQLRLKLASACDAHGWGFTDGVLSQVAALVPLPAAPTRSP